MGVKQNNEGEREEIRVRMRTRINKEVWWEKGGRGTVGVEGKKRERNANTERKN